MGKANKARKGASSATQDTGIRNGGSNMSRGDGTVKNNSNDLQDVRKVDYGKYLEEGTKIIMEITSSPDVDDEEKHLLVDAFSNELANNVGNADNLKDAGPLLYGISVIYVDGKITEEFSKSYVSAEGCRNGIKLCRRQQDLFTVFEERKWKMPEVRNTNLGNFIETFQDWEEGFFIGDRIVDEDKQLDSLIEQARKDISVETCDRALTLLSKLEEDISSYKEKGFVLSDIFKKDTIKVRKQINDLRVQAQKKDELYAKINDVDYDIQNIVSQRGTTEEQWQEVIALCQKQSGNLSECEKNGWPLPTMKNAGLEELKEQYKHYSVMLQFDRQIALNGDVLSDNAAKESKETYEDFYGLCKSQEDNIATCKKKRWYIPELAVPNPGAYAESIREKKEKKDKSRRLRLITIFAVLAISSAIIGTFAYRHGKTQVPFDSSSVEGGNVNELYAELEEAGFENISKRKDTSGWLKDGEATSVTIDGSFDFKLGQYFKPDVDVVIYYSSEGRKDITKLLMGWNSKNYEALGDEFRKAGFSDISYVATTTYDKNQNLKVASVSPHGSIYRSGSCYIPPNATIVINYYSLKIKMEKAASKFEGNNYSSVVEGLRRSGFTNIELQRLDDLKIGLFKKAGEISSIRIDGQSAFEKETEFDYYSPIVIVVHTFPGQGCDDITILAN